MASSTSAGDHTKRRPMCRSVRQRREYHGSRVSLATTKGSPCQQGDVSEVARMIPVLELDKFPEDILHHIHSLVPLRDAARIACVSRTFLSSWRCFPNLAFSYESLGLNLIGGDRYKKAKGFVDRAYCILQNHSGIGVKTFKIHVAPCWSIITASQLDSWLQAAVKSGIEVLELDRLGVYESGGPQFNFPYSLLSCAASSLQSLSLLSCAFHPTLAIGCMRSLKSVRLSDVKITEDELGCFFSCTISLEKLDVCRCQEITLLMIPSLLLQLRILDVFDCGRLQMIEIYARKVTTFSFVGKPLKISISDSSQLTSMTMNGIFHSGMLQYALTKLHSIASNLQVLSLVSYEEGFNLPSSPHKFLHVRHLNISCKFQSFDFSSMISFLEACPVLENLFLWTGQHFYVREDSVLEGSNSLRIRRIPEFCHHNLKKVTIFGFSSAKSLFDLLCKILECCSSLEHLVLHTTRGYREIRESMDKTAVTEALKGVEDYIKGKVSESFILEVLGPCDQISCVHTDLWRTIAKLRIF
ncbi:hypothetical protein EJB05_56231, partial [Eragrostis curvula]